MDSILTSTKKLLNILEDCEHFDPDIIMHINSVFMILNQLGVGPDEGFSIEDSSTLWSDYLPNGPLVNAVKSYMGLKVRLLFDPPSSSVLMESHNRLINELEWRMRALAEQTNQESEDDT